MTILKTSMTLFALFMLVSTQAYSGVTANGKTAKRQTLVEAVSAIESNEILSRLQVHKFPPEYKKIREERCSDANIYGFSCDDVQDVNFKTSSKMVEELRLNGLMPKHKVQIEGKELYFSKVFRFLSDGNYKEKYADDLKKLESKYRYGIFIFVRVGQEYVLRFAYTSKSHVLFKITPFVLADLKMSSKPASEYNVDGIEWFSKGKDESLLILPNIVQLFLFDQMYQKELDEVDVRTVILLARSYSGMISGFGFDAIIEVENTTFSQKLQPVDIFDSGEVISSKPYQSDCELKDKIISGSTSQVVNGETVVEDMYQEVKSRQYFEPTSVKLKRQDAKPNFAGLVSSASYNSAIYGHLVFERYYSFDGSLDYLIARDKKNRIFIASIQSVGYGLSSYGVKLRGVPYSNSEFLNNAALTPLWERVKYVHPQYFNCEKNEVKSSYFLTWNYIKHIDIVNEYYETRGIARPE